MPTRSLPYGALFLGLFLILLLVGGAVFLQRSDEVSYQKPEKIFPDEVPPSTPPPSEETPETTENSSPQVQDVVVTSLSPLPLRNGSVIEGKAKGNWFFEASFPIELHDESGRVVGVGIAQADGDWMTTDYVPFHAALHFSPPVSSKGTLVFKKDNPSGLPEHDKSETSPVEILVEDKGPTDIALYIGFISEKDAARKDCTKILSSVRIIPKTAAVAKAALEELLSGPTIGEIGDGMLTIIPQGTKLHSLLIKDGVAQADFNAALGKGAGSCTVGAIRAQITETLLQFPTVREVVISIDGKTEGILEP